MIETKRVCQHISCQDIDPLKSYLKMNRRAIAVVRNYGFCALALQFRHRTRRIFRNRSEGLPTRFYRQSSKGHFNRELIDRHGKGSLSRWFRRGNDRRQIAQHGVTAESVRLCIRMSICFCAQNSTTDHKSLQAVNPVRSVVQSRPRTDHP